MSSKTKIIVLHLKELIYTGIFAALGILFIILLIIMFLPKEKKQETMSTVAQQTTANSYVPGVYTTSLILNDNVAVCAVADGVALLTDLDQQFDMIGKFIGFGFRKARP